MEQNWMQMCSFHSCYLIYVICCYSSGFNEVIPQYECVTKSKWLEHKDIYVHLELSFFFSLISSPMLTKWWTNWMPERNANSIWNCHVYKYVLFFISFHIVLLLLLLFMVLSVKLVLVVMMGVLVVVVVIVALLSTCYI